MEKFQRIIIKFAVVLLIISLILIVILMNNNTKPEQWPPLIGDCPDYWVDTSGNGSNCVNVKNLGKCTSMDFTIPCFTGSQGLCYKYKWANKCGVSWDGITYGVENSCPSDPSSSEDIGVGVVAGITIEVVVLSGLICYFCYFLYEKRQAIMDYFSSQRTYFFPNSY